MSGFEVQRLDERGKVTFQVHGDVDAQAADALQAMVLQVDPRCEVVVDFSHAREFLDVSVGVLTRALSLRPVQLCGLCTHQARMFGYFGIHTGEGDRGYYTPEDLLVA